MSRIPADQIAYLRELGESMPKPGSPMAKLVSESADVLRRHAHDIDDAAIGDIVLALVNILHVSLTGVRVRMKPMELLQLATAIGLDLTAIEWQEAPRG